jgi:hypothetical protein
MPMEKRQAARQGEEPALESIEISHRLLLPTGDDVAANATTGCALCNMID